MDILKRLDLYIKENLIVVKERRGFFSNSSFKMACCEECSIDSYIDENKDNDNFQKLLFEFIDSRGLKDSDVYNKALIDRKLFSKIRNSNYHPSKSTVIMLCLALELSLDDSIKLLESASYSLPKNNIFDLIIRFCFINEIYDIDEVNNLLMSKNEKILGRF